MSKKISVNLYSPLHQHTLKVEDITWEKDTANVLLFALSNFWNPPKIKPILYIKMAKIEDLTQKSIKDLGINDGDWIAVGWEEIKEDDNTMILC